MQLQHSHTNAQRGSYHPGLLQDSLVLPDAVSQPPIAAHPEDAAFFEQFRPMPLSLLIAWLFRSRVVPPQPKQQEPEPFEEHINGLA